MDTGSKSGLYFYSGALSRSALVFVCDDTWILWNMDHDFAHLAHEFGHVISSNNRLLHAVDWIPVLLISTLPVALLVSAKWSKTLF